MGGIFFLSGLVSCILGIAAVSRSLRLRRHGLSATATVVDRRSEAARGSKGERWFTYYVTVCWQGADEAEFKADRQVEGRPRWDALRIGSQHPILYLSPTSGSPSGAVEFEFADETPSERYEVGCWIWAVIGLGAGGAAVVWGLSQMPR
ncbi:MAG: hypothetical protein FJX75_10695 [Armatimonadetes bacterium]|nr:hypothetical protein [Armatimonadota bacterium]